MAQIGNFLIRNIETILKSALYTFLSEGGKFMKRSRCILVIIMVFITIVIIPLSALAHSGRTDSSGGHRDNKNKSGLGSYHYHCGGHPPHLHSNGVCPYSSNTINSYSSSSMVSVPKETYASSVKFTNVPKKLNVDDTIKIEYTVYPNDAVNKEVIWKSSNNDIAMVSSDGVVTAVGSGTATITATTSNNKSASFKVLVNEVLADSVTIINKLSEITVNETVTLRAELLPKNTTYKTIDWTSSNSEIAQVDANGNLKALKSGEVTITAKQKNKSDYFHLVVKPTKAYSIKITTTSKRIQKGDTLSLEAVVLPDNAEDKDIKWTVDNETIATINNNILTTIKTGTIKVTATTVSGKSDSMYIEIYSNESAGAIIGGAVILGSGIVYYFKKKKKSS